MIYHICNKNDWENALQKGFYKPENYEKDGFIHFSKPEQVCDTANRFYKNNKDLVLLEVEDQEDPLVRFENPPENPGDLFPYYYGILRIEKVLRVLPFPQQEDGTFTLNSNINSGKSYSK